MSSEYQGIISENYLFQILDSDYKSYLQTLPGRSNYNPRKSTFQPFIDELSRKVSDEFNIGQEIYIIDSANVHDVKTSEMMTKGVINDVKLLGDKGYIAKNVQLNLFEEFKIKVITPPRNNQMGPSPWTPRDRRIRKRIEITFSQFCDQFRMKLNFAKSFHGLSTRIYIPPIYESFKRQTSQ